MSFQRWHDLLGFAFGLGLALALFGCASTPAADAPTKAQLSSVVTLVEAQPEYREPGVSDDGFGQGTVTMGLAWQGRCNAFALRRKAGGDLYLVTAAHCLRERALGAVVRYLPPDGWGVDRATLVRLDEGRDYAELTPSREGGLVALEQGPVPGPGEAVVGVSSYFEALAPGVSTGSLGGTWAGTTQRVEHGWSGSPVLSGGKVWGFISKCELVAGRCVQGTIVGVL